MDFNFKLPKTVGQAADRLYKLKEMKAELAKQEAAIEEEQKALKAFIINTLPKSEATGVAGKVARVTVVTKEVPRVEDWDLFWSKFNKKTDYDLLNRAINVTAANLRLDAGKKVPGVGLFSVTSVSLNKV
jgi:hypothetical protein